MKTKKENIRVTMPIRKAVSCFGLPFVARALMKTQADVKRMVQAESAICDVECKITGWSKL